MHLDVQFGTSCEGRSRQEYIIFTKVSRRDALGTLPVEA
jgi:hypothetical protein